MADLTGKRIVVAGAGVLGLSVALRAAAAGAKVEVWDPAPAADNASGVAAGMIAPLGERVFDPGDDGVFPLLRAGRDGWPDLQALAPGLVVDRSGAMFQFPDKAAAQAALDCAKRLGAVLSPPNVPPHHASPACALFTPEDWRIDPVAAIGAMRAALSDHGAILTPRRLGVDKFAAFDAVVIAAGFHSRRFAAAAPELLALEPIKGQIVRFEHPAAARGALRTPDLYLVSQGGAVLAGATMEAGRDDRIVEAEAVAALRRRALALMPALEGSDYHGAAGVRASTPDGLPLAGPSSRPKLYLATGARRNGWLLAPLVSQVVVSYLSGGDGGPFAAALDPRRFSPV